MICHHHLLRRRLAHRRSGLRALLLLALVSAVPLRANSLAGDPWLDVLGALLAAHYQAPGELSVAWSRPPPGDLPAEPRVELVAVPPALASQLLVTVLVADAGGTTTRHTLVLRAELWLEGWSSREPTVAGSPVVPETLDVVRFDALRERRALASDVSLELDFLRSIAPGRLLTWNDVRRRPLVRRGQAVDVAASDGNLSVTLRAIALHDASRGQPVRVRNPDSRKEFTAVVVAESRATVTF